MSTVFLFANNAATTLAGAITNTSTVLNLASGTGVLFPSPATGQQFSITLTDAATGQIREIMYCTSRTGDTLTVTRGQESTTAVAWNAGDIVAQLLTAGTMGNMIQSGGNGGRINGEPQVYTTTTSGVSFPPNTNAFMLEICGGGGTGGPACATGANQTSTGSGGWAGGFVKAFVTGYSGAVNIQIGAGGSTAWTTIDGFLVGSYGQDTILTCSVGTYTAAGAPGGSNHTTPASTSAVFSGSGAPLASTSSSGPGVISLGNPTPGSIGMGSGGSVDLGIIGNGAPCADFGATNLGFGTGGDGASQGPNLAAISGVGGQTGVAILTPYII